MLGGWAAALLLAHCHRERTTTGDVPLAQGDKAEPAPSAVVIGPIEIDHPFARVLRSDSTGGLDGCADPGLRKCLSDLVKPKLGAADVERALDTKCFAHEPIQLWEQTTACLPLRLGTDARNGRDLWYGYHCSDICPSQGSWTLTYRGVTDEMACCSTGGYPMQDSWTHDYVACAPPQIAARLGSYHVGKDGKWRRIVESRCSHQTLILEEWPCRPLDLGPFGITGGDLPRNTVYARGAKIVTSRATCSDAGAMEWPYRENHF